VHQNVLGFARSHWRAYNAGLKGGAAPRRERKKRGERTEKGDVTRTPKFHDRSPPLAVIYS